MTLHEQRIQETLALVKQFPGKAGLAYWKKLHVSESRRPYVNKWLRELETRGDVRHEEVLIEGRVYARLWWPVKEG